MTGKLIPFAKISDQSVKRIVQGFCCGEAITEIAEATGVSEKTCRTIVLALRPRLLELPFDQWRDALMLHFFDPEVEAIAQAMVFGVLASCYFNRSCYTNFQQGRRTVRQCKSCLVPVLEMGDDFTAAALYHIDLVHGFYAVLGIGGERGIGKLSRFRLRLTHTQIVGEAIEATRRLDDDRPDFSDTGDLTVRALYDRLLISLQQTPLKRGTPEADPRLAEYEDLSFLT